MSPRLWPLRSSIGRGVPWVKMPAVGCWAGVCGYSGAQWRLSVGSVEAQWRLGGASVEARWSRGGYSIQHGLRRKCVEASGGRRRGGSGPRDLRAMVACGRLVSSSGGAGYGGALGVATEAAHQQARPGQLPGSERGLRLELCRGAAVVRVRVGVIVSGAKWVNLGGGSTVSSETSTATFTSRHSSSAQAHLP